MTEDEARTKWCPFGRILLRNDLTHKIKGFGKKILLYLRLSDSFNRNEVGSPHVSPCIASDCMAWRSTPGFPINGHCGLAGDEK